MRKFHLNLLLCAIICTSSFITLAKTETNTALSFSPEVVYPEGDYFTVSLQIDTTVGVYAFGAVIEFPKYHRFVMIESIFKGDFLAGGYFTYSADSFLGKIIVGGTLVGQSNGISGSGSLAVIEFKVLDSGEYPITLSETTLLDSSLIPIPHTTENAYLLTRGNKPSGMGYLPFKWADRISLVDPHVDFHLSVDFTSLLEYYQRPWLILVFTGPPHIWGVRYGDRTWKYELSTASLENSDLWYEESIVGIVQIIYYSDMESSVDWIYEERPFSLKLELFDRYGDGTDYSDRGYNVHWWSSTIDSLDYEFNIQRLYELRVLCENGSWSCSLSN